MKFQDRASTGADGFHAHPIINLADQPCKPRGFVEINKWRGNVGSGSMVDQIMTAYTPVSENLVVTLARRVMSRLLSGAAQWDDGGSPTDPTVTLTDSGHPSYPEATITGPEDLFITKMRWGTGGHDIGNPTIPLDPAVGDEHLVAPLVSPAYKTVTVDYPADSTVRFTGILETGDANGQGISEVGLFTDQYELMFARKTFGILTKSSDFSFEFRYSIIF